MNLANNKPNR